MRLKPLLWLLVSVACFIGAVYFWRLGDRWQREKTAARPAPASETSAKPASASSVKPLNPSVMALLPLVQSATNTPATHVSPRLKYRLTNTDKTTGQLARIDHALLLANALIDSSQPVNLEIPDAYRLKEDPGAYIVQSRGPINARFRAALKEAGAEIVAYIPNNAYLVRASAGGRPAVAARPADAGGAAL